MNKPKKLYFKSDFRAFSGGEEAEPLGLGDAMEVKRAMLLNAMDAPGGLDTSLTAAEEPIGEGAENLAAEKERTHANRLS